MYRLQYIPKKYKFHCQKKKYRHHNICLNLYTLINLNKASYFLNILASPDVSTWSTTGGYIWGSQDIKKVRGNVQVKQCVFIHKFRQMLWWQYFFFWQWNLYFVGVYWSRYIVSGFIWVIFQRWVLCCVKKNDMKKDK